MLLLFAPILMTTLFLQMSNTFNLPKTHWIKKTRIPQSVFWDDGEVSWDISDDEEIQALMEKMLYTNETKISVIKYR
jgi:hypothetical protein